MTGMWTKRLNVEDPNVFDTWREIYHTLTDAEQAEFYDDLEAKYPHQQHFHAEWFAKAFEKNQTTHVLEVGGWKGELASQMLARFPHIATWHNIELCQKATHKTVDMPRSGYSFENPEAFDWFNVLPKPTCDVLVSAHTIEHLFDTHLWSMLEWASGVPLICLEAPISFSKNDWKGYGGTHILEAGWGEIIGFMDQKGYSAEFVSEHCFFFRLR